MNYRLIVIENSLKDKNILSGYALLSETTFAPGTDRASRMLKMEIPYEKVDTLAKEIEKNLIPPFYAYLYEEDRKNDHLIILFTNKRFDEKKKYYPNAFLYGTTHGVAKEEMIITPTEITEETW
jgi:hypothetical protein